MQESYKNERQMIIELRLANIFSIRDEITLDLTSGKSKSDNASKLADNEFTALDYKLLKTAPIFGANASGKSNVLKAVAFCRDLVLNSHNNNEGTVFGFEPFKFEGYSDRESSFLIRFVYDGVEYEYSFSFIKTGITKESLSHSPNGRMAEVFTRDESKGPEKSAIYSFRPAVKRPLDVAVNTSRKTLFVSRASQMDRDIAKKVYAFFLDGMDFMNPLGADSQMRLFSAHRNILLDALRIADSDIADIRLGTTATGAPHFVTYHSVDKAIPFDLDTEESDGTRKLFYALLRVVDAVAGGKTLFWDEIDSSLHPKIVEYIFAFFHCGDGAQLVCTTHDTNLLDLHKLRKDQIYFANKKDNGATELYSLFDFKDFRDTMNLQKAYIQGRFDAVPYVDASAKTLKRLFADA